MQHRKEVREETCQCGGVFALSGVDREMLGGKPWHPGCLDKAGYACRRIFYKTIDNISQIINDLYVIAEEESLKKLKIAVDIVYGELKRAKERHTLHYCNKKKKQCSKLKKFLQGIVRTILGAIQAIPKWIWEEVKSCVDRIGQIFEGLTGKKLKLVF